MISTLFTNPHPRKGQPSKEDYANRNFLYADGPHEEDEVLFDLDGNRADGEYPVVSELVELERDEHLNFCANEIASCALDCISSIGSLSQIEKAEVLELILERLEARLKSNAKFRNNS